MLPSCPPEYTPFTRLKPGDYHFHRKLSDDRILDIFLEIINEEELWGVEGKVVLSSVDGERIHKIDRVLKPRQGIWIGSWHEPFARWGVSENCDADIPKELLGNLAGKSLIRMKVLPVATVSGTWFVYESDYLELVGPHTGSFPIKYGVLFE